MKVVVIAAMAVLLAACSGSAARDADEPQPTVEPTPTPAPWDLEVVDPKYTAKTNVGEDLTVTVKITNHGKKDNPDIQLQFSDINEYADLGGCKPKCTVTDLFGVYTEMPGVPAGETKTYRINWIANEVGAVNWSVCVYDAATAGNQIGCYDATTTIRK